MRVLPPLELPSILRRMPIRINEIDLDRARSLRRSMTKAETMLWRALRDRRLSGYKFRRQFPVGPYVADFACIATKMIVELDGPSHDRAEGQERDARRDAWLRDQGWRVLRLSNGLMLASAELAVAEIRRAIEAAESPSSDLR